MRKIGEYLDAVLSQNIAPEFELLIYYASEESLGLSRVVLNLVGRVEEHIGVIATRKEENFSFKEDINDFSLRGIVAMSSRGIEVSRNLAINARLCFLLWEEFEDPWLVLGVLALKCIKARADSTVELFSALRRHAMLATK